MANIIKRFARHRDDMRLANFQRVRGLDAEWKLLRSPTKHRLPNLTPLWATQTEKNNTQQRERRALVRHRLFDLEPEALVRSSTPPPCNSARSAGEQPETAESLIIIHRGV